MKLAIKHYLNVCTGGLARDETTHRQKAADETYPTAT
jgi:hypothetical protein